MKFYKNNSLVESNLHNSKEFTIAMNSKTFTMLSDTLYSNKIKAIIRELSCNAYNSHIASNNINKPFEINLPTLLNPIFSIRDYGTGLSEHNLTTIFLIYGESTKDDSNDQIGCYGIGAKSPFAYTDLFTVISYYNNIQYTYTVYLDNGIPKASKVFEIETQEENGLMIMFNVEKEDIKEFEKETINVFKFFKTLPNFNIELNIKKDFYEITNDLYSINLNTNLKEIIAIQGNIAYPIDNSKIKLLPFIFGELMLNFNIGEFAFVPSREALSYDKDTINVINKRIELIKDNIINEIKKKLNQSQSLLEYTKLLIHNIHKLDLKNKEINEYKLNEFNGIKIDLNEYSHLSLKNTNFKIIAENNLRNHFLRKLCLKTNKYNKSIMYFHIDNQYKLIINDTNNKNAHKLLIEQSYKIKFYHMLLLDPDTKDLEFIKENYGNIVYNLSDLIEIQKEEILKNKNISIGQAFSFSDSMVCPFESIIELKENKQYYYIPIEKKKTKSLVINLFNHNLEIQKGRHFNNLIPKNSEIIFVNKSFIKSNKNKNIKSFENYIKLNFQKVMKNYIKYKEFYDVFNKFNNNSQFDFYKFKIKELIDINNDFTQINKLIKIYNRAYKKHKTTHYKEMGSIVYDFLFKLLYDKEKHSYFNFISYDNFIYKFPMLKYVSSYNKHYVEFINYTKERTIILQKQEKTL